MDLSVPRINLQDFATAKQFSFGLIPPKCQLLLRHLRPGRANFSDTVTLTGVGLLTTNGGTRAVNGWSSDSGTPVKLVGGTFDLNGNSETVYTLTINHGGTLRNGAPSTTSTLTLTSPNLLTLANADSFFDVPAPDAFLDISGCIAGSGSFIPKR
jgi:hypothetical protein